jgi:hypothetical protein
MMAPVDALRDKESPGGTVRGFQEVSQLSRDQGALDAPILSSLHGAELLSQSAGAELLSRWGSDAPRPTEYMLAIERIAHISDQMRAVARAGARAAAEEAAGPKSCRP